MSAEYPQADEWRHSDNCFLKWTETFRCTCGLDDYRHALLDVATGDGCVGLRGASNRAAPSPVGAPTGPLMVTRAVSGPPCPACHHGVWIVSYSVAVLVRQTDWATVLTDFTITETMCQSCGRPSGP